MGSVAALAAVLGLVLGAVAGFLIASSRDRARHQKALSAGEDEASRLLARAREEADNLKRAGELEGKDAAIQLRESWEKEETRRREEIERAERRAEERADSWMPSSTA